MAMPNSEEARLYYRCALRRYDEAQVLLDADHTTGAVYLAGYGIECILKALVLESLTPTARPLMLKSFRGRVAHDFEWLRTQYLKLGGAELPRELIRAFTVVDDWSTDIRQSPANIEGCGSRGVHGRDATDHPVGGREALTCQSESGLARPTTSSTR